MLGVAILSRCEAVFIAPAYAIRYFKRKGAGAWKGTLESPLVLFAGSQSFLIVSPYALFEDLL
ncbi:MAG: hypothetical protein HYY68_09285 [Thaumarchaeota archaeon]|nr:hypothetical protein [Nitrososphaerota archaeon]